jgi:hypothetical protein
LFTEQPTAADERVFFTKQAGKTQLVLTNTMPRDNVLRVQLTAGNNRGFIVWFDVKRNESFWLTSALTWSSAVPATRPFLFLTQALVTQ